MAWNNKSSSGICFFDNMLWGTSSQGSCMLYRIWKSRNVFEVQQSLSAQSLNKKCAYSHRNSAPRLLQLCLQKHFIAEGSGSKYDIKWCLLRGSFHFDEFEHANLQVGNRCFKLYNYKGQLIHRMFNMHLCLLDSRQDRKGPVTVNKPQWGVAKNMWQTYFGESRWPMCLS